MNGCTTNNGGCDKICIPLPNNGSKCDCPNGETWNSTQLKCVYDQGKTILNTKIHHLTVLKIYTYIYT